MGGLQSGTDARGRVERGWQPAGKWQWAADARLPFSETSLANAATLFLAVFVRERARELKSAGERYCRVPIG